MDTDQKRGLGARGAAALNASLALDGAVVMVSETNRKVSLVISGQILAVATAQELFASLLNVMVSSESAVDDEWVCFGYDIATIDRSAAGKSSRKQTYSETCRHVDMVNCLLTRTDRAPTADSEEEIFQSVF